MDFAFGKVQSDPDLKLLQKGVDLCPGFRNRSENVKSIQKLQGFLNLICRAIGLGVISASKLTDTCFQTGQ